MAVGDQLLDRVARPAVDEQRAEPGDVALVEIRRADGGEQTCVLQSDEVPRQREQHRRLALAQVLADRLAGRGLVAEDAEQVITQLEGLAERPTKGAERLDHVGVSAREGCAEVQGALDRVRPRLVPGDEEGAFDGQGTPARPHDVEVLTHHQLRAQLVPDRPDVGAGRTNEPIGARKGQVADKDADTLTEPSSLPPPPGPAMGLVERAMQRRPAATSGRTIHDVVVDEGEAVKQLDAGGDVQPRAVVRIAARGQEAVAAEQRAEPLAAGQCRPRQEVDRFCEPRVDGGPAVTLAPQDGAEVVFDFGGDELVGGSIERGDAGQLHPANLALN